MSFANNPLVSDDDDSSSSNYVESTDSSMILPDPRNSRASPVRKQSVPLSSSDIASSKAATSKLTTMNTVGLEKLSMSIHQDMSNKQDPTKIIDDILAPYTTASSEKIMVRFLAVGSTRQIEPRVFRISQTQQFMSLMQFLHKKFGLGNDREHVFCYLHNSFSPSPDDNVGALYRIFGTGSELVVSYCENVAFG